jgi:hypothetical protein
MIVLLMSMLLALSIVLSTASTPPTPECVPGQQNACACAAGTAGFQKCGAYGRSYGVCACASPEAKASALAAEALERRRLLHEASCSLNIRGRRDTGRGDGRVAEPFGFGLTGQGMRLSRTRLLSKVTRVMSEPCGRG